MRTGASDGGPTPAIFFLSDYGTADEFVGVVRALLHRLAPARPVIDLSHQIPPFDVEAGAAMLVRCAPFLGAGVVLAVVDPGVGTPRRGVAIGVAGDGPSWLVGPDNGLLVPMAAGLGGVERVVLLDPRRSSPLTGPSASGRTFDGRDLFAPAAAHLATGGPVEALGSAIEPASLALPSATPSHHDRVEASPDGPAVITSVTWVDHFGNVQLRLRPEVLEDIGLSVGGAAQVTVERVDPPGDGDGLGAVGRPTRARLVPAFGDVEAGELGLVLDSNGQMALVLDRASAALHLHVRGPGDTVRISTRPADETGS
ncbi:MAG: SAM-dependent chlorinase/fluorinase [Acidimicrobiales bacterium]|nr:SAM-dependent chlorinase/fluorinase [Acidimicrobiales bacterium]